MVRNPTNATKAVSRPRRRAAPSILQISIAVPDAPTAARISTALLAQHLAACVQTVGPVTSRYLWQGGLETAAEFLLLVKTRASLYGAVEAAVRALHPYEVPEILAMPVQHGLAGYVDWVVESTPPVTAPGSKPAPVRRPRGAAVKKTPSRRGR